MKTEIKRERFLEGWYQFEADGQRWQAQPLGNGLFHILKEFSRGGGFIPYMTVKLKEKTNCANLYKAIYEKAGQNNGGDPVSQIPPSFS